MKGQAKALKDPAVQKRIKEVDRLQKANVALKNSILGVSKSAQTNTKVMDTGAVSLLKYAKAAGALIILRQTARLFVEFSLAAKQYSKSLIALDTLTQAVGLSSEQLVLSMQKATKSQISLTELTAISNRAIALLGEQAIPKFKEIATVASKAAQVMGTTVSKAFNDFVIGAGRQSRLILDNLGLIVSAERANINYAASLGKTADQLTEVERKQAFLNEALTQAKQKYRDIVIQADDVAVFNAKWADMKITIGEGLLPALEALASVSSEIIDSFQFLSDEIRKNRKEYELLAPKIEDVNDQIIGFNAKTREFIFSTKQETIFVKALGDEYERLAEQRRMVAGVRAPIFDPSTGAAAPFGLLPDQVNDIEAAFQALTASKFPDAIKTLKDRSNELRKTLAELRDPEVQELIKEVEKYEKLLRQELNPTLNKTKKNTDLVKESFEDFAATMREFETLSGVGGGLFGPQFKQGLDDFKAIALGIDELQFKVPPQFTAFGRNIRDKFGQDALALGGGDGEIDPNLDITAMSLQFGQAITNAFKSSSVTNTIASVMTAGVQFAASLTQAGIASGNPYVAGIAIVASLFEAFGGGGKTAPVITKPIDVRLVEITGNVAAKLLGVSQRRVIAAGSFSRGADSRQQLRVMD